MDSRQLIRSTRKTLAAITLLNQHDALRVSEVARELSLPRTTAFRILETLRELGYVERHEHDGRYAVTEHVLTLSARAAERRNVVTMLPQGQQRPFTDRIGA
jgi:DNA-binding IclR family transcriptional regulator